MLREKLHLSGDKRRPRGGTCIRLTGVGEPKRPLFLNFPQYWPYADAGPGALESLLSYGGALLPKTPTAPSPPYLPPGRPCAKLV